MLARHLQLLSDDQGARQTAQGSRTRLEALWKTCIPLRGEDSLAKGLDRPYSPWAAHGVPCQVAAHGCLGREPAQRFSSQKVSLANWMSVFAFSCLKQIRLSEVESRHWFLLKPSKNTFAQAQLLSLCSLPNVMSHNETLKLMTINSLKPICCMCEGICMSE